jgi:arylsulfatase A
VEEVDWAVGKIMRALKQSGADDNTLVLFTSDNGSPVHGDPEVSVGRFQP